jgi:hypothetical protein
MEESLERVAEEERALLWDESLREYFEPTVSEKTRNENKRRDKTRREIDRLH